MRRRRLDRRRAAGALSAASAAAGGRRSAVRCRRSRLPSAAAPPATVAVHKGGQHALELARAGGHQVRAAVHVQLTAAAQRLPQREAAARAAAPQCIRFGELRVELG